MASKQATINFMKKRDTATMQEYVVCHVCRLVGEVMKADEAVLLPTLQKYLISEMYECVRS